MGRLIIISNRLPFSVDKIDDDILVRQSSGGLVSAIKSYFENPVDGVPAYTERLWVGSMDAKEEDWKAAAEKGDIPNEFSILPIFPQKEVYEDYYNGFSNSTLWPLFHYFPSLVENKKEYYDAYRKINQLFADTILRIVEDGDVIWIHDYQLMLLPQLLRQQIPGATIGFFLHIPFPSYEIYRLPVQCGKFTVDSAYFFLNAFFSVTICLNGIPGGNNI